MIDLEREQLIPVREVPKRLPRKSRKRVHVATIYRWMERGLRSIRLEYIKVGGTRYTSIEALQRFAERLSEQDAAPEIPSPAAQSKRAARARKEVERILYGRNKKKGVHTG